MIKKTYSSTEQEFVFQWADHWFQLTTLIFDLIHFDRTPPSPPPPTELDEINYQRIRFWFIDHESQFIPLWKDFYEAQDWDLHPDDESLVDIPDADEYVKNPFFFCYRPENLYQLVRELDVQSGVGIWDPSEHRAWEAWIELLKMGGRVVEFFEWICDHTPSYH